MRKHILISTFILLTAGCQPNSDGNLLSQSETDLYTRNSKDSGEVSVKTLQGGQVSKYDQKITVEQSTEATQSQSQASAQEVIRAKVLDAVVRLRMDLAGIMNPTPETILLEKLIQESKDTNGIAFYRALKENRMPFALPLSPTNVVDISLLAQAFKQAAAFYGFDTDSQEQISNAILKRSTLLAPLESQKVMASVNAELLQNKVNTLIEATALNFSAFCPSLNGFITSGENFYEDKQYALPSLIGRKLTIFKSILKSEIADCATGKISRTRSLIENVDSVVEAVGFDRGSLELYLTPANDFNWEEYKNYKVKAVLQEAKFPGQARLSFSDILCTIDGRQLQLTDITSPAGGGEVAGFDYTLDGVNPLVLERSASQRGVTLAFVAQGIKVTTFNKMTLTKIKPDVLVPAVNLIPGQKQEFSLFFHSKKGSAESHLQCQVQGL
ncbi:hypothetical protein [Bdellovibrio sp. HCB274]|uniref:hypothetical protein n=1 Tax=Bdellovibrio sp. HCB274 TaxID=3394361 RepID=UPI0039B57625